MIGLQRTLLHNEDAGADVNTNTDADANADANTKAKQRGPGSVNANTGRCVVKEVSEHRNNDQIQGKRLYDCSNVTGL